MKRIYLDYAASTPVAPEVEKAMRPYFLDEFGNAGSLHSFGQKAIAVLDESRETIGKAIGAGFREIIFTGSATEANNLALRGAVKAFRNNESRITNNGIKSKNIIHNSSFIIPRVIVSAIEHESVLETARDLEKEGIEVIYLPVSKKGIVDVEKLEESLNEQTILVSVMYANNEIGTIQPISEIAKIIGDFRNRKSEIRNSKSESKNNSNFKFQISNLGTTYPLFHTDAVQAFQFLDCDARKLGVDMMTLSAHKIYGPKGVGALYAGSRVSGLGSRDEKNKTLNPSGYTLNPIITGGGQEFGLRSGTENIPAIVGFAKAVGLILNPGLRQGYGRQTRDSESKRIGALRDYFWKRIKKIYPAAKRNGDEKKVLPNFLNIYFPDRKAADLLVAFDLAGLAVSVGSACTARSAEASYVIKALGAGVNPVRSRPRQQASATGTSGRPASNGMEPSGHSIRITLGRPTSKKDVDTALKIVRKLLNTK